MFSQAYLMKSSGLKLANKKLISSHSRRLTTFASTQTEKKTEVLPVREPGNFPPVGHDCSPAVEEPKPVAEEDEFDPLRDGPARYLGYANEVGEAFRAWLPSFGVPLSYAIAIGYVLTDTVDKTKKAYDKASSELSSDTAIPETVDVGRLTTLLTAERFVDTLVWQMAASVIIPGSTIHFVVDVVHWVLSENLLNNANGDVSLLPAAAAAFVTSTAATLHSDPGTVLTYLEKTVPTLCGLGVIPFIVHPIDDGVHFIMDNSIRPAFKNYICGPGQGSEACLDLCDTCKVEES